MKPRLILVSLGLLALTILSFGLQAQEQTAPQAKDNISTSQQQLARQFADFQDALLRLKQRLARGTPEEKRRSEVLEKVLEECKNLAINQEFTKMIEILRGAKLTNTGELEQLKNQSDEITQRIRRILDLLQNSNTDRLSQERKDLEKFIKDLEKVIQQQKIVQAQTEQNKTENTELQKNQEKVTDNTSKLEKGLKEYLNKDKGDKGGEAANLKGENKDAKGEGKKGEAKDAGKDSKGTEAKGESKDAGKESQGAKGEAKAGDKGKESSKSEDEPKANSKTGDKGKEGSPAGAKDKKDVAKGQEGSAKGGDKAGEKGKEGAAKDSGSKDGDPKKDGPQGSAKAGDDKKPGSEQGKPGSPDTKAKTGEKSGSDPKQAGAKDSKPGEPKGSDPKGGDPKGEAKSGDAKGDPKQGEAKSGDPKSGEAKDGGSPPKGGQPMDSPPQAAQKGEQPPPQQPPSAGDKQQNDDVAKANKKVKEAGYDQKIAEDKIAKKDNGDASKNQGDAINKLEEAKKKLERLLQQMREDELERVLAALQARCEKMLIMQQQVLSGTLDVHAAIGKSDDKKPNQLNKKESLRLSDQEKLIVLEANKCIDILEAEGSAVAFPEVFQQVRQDMMHVQKRLELTDVADVTQGIERDVIDTLKEMIDALKKAQQDMKDKDSKPGKPGKSGPPGDQKLLELIQELKMVRSLQKRVNDRTQVYGRRFPGQEQTNDPQITRELRSLSERQQRIQDIVSRIAKGDNK